MGTRIEIPDLPVLDPDSEQLGPWYVSPPDRRLVREVFVHKGPGVEYDEAPEILVSIARAEKLLRGFIRARLPKSEISYLEAAKLLPAAWRDVGPEILSAPLFARIFRWAYHRKETGGAKPELKDALRELGELMGRVTSAQRKETRGHLNSFAKIDEDHLRLHRALIQKAWNRTVKAGASETKIRRQLQEARIPHQVIGGEAPRPFEAPEFPPDTVSLLARVIARERTRKRGKGRYKERELAMAYRLEMQREQGEPASEDAREAAERLKNRRRYAQQRTRNSRQKKADSGPRN